MSKLKKISFYFFHPRQFLIYHVLFPKVHKMSDEQFLKWRYRLSFKKKLSLDNPQSFTEKLQWLKLYYRDPLYSTFVDKYQAKKYVAQRIGVEYVIPTLAVFDTVDEIEYGTLPKSFVMKTTHDGGGQAVVICQDKSTFDFEAAKEKLTRSLSRSTTLYSKEWPYEYVKRRVIVEDYLYDDENEGLLDYKFFCFGGKVKIFKVDFDRQTSHRANYYDLTGKILPFGEKVCPPLYNKKIEFPANLDEMINIAEKLSANIPFVRVDLYNVRGKIYFGELTIFPGSGLDPLTDASWDMVMGQWLTLPPKSKISTV